jgi:hypothetical protein
MAFTAIAGFFHYVGIGPDETDDEDEAKAAELAKKLAAKPTQQGTQEKAP